jgi:dTDP-4-amino-4,6-dideoxygalactose transaminase
MVLAVVPTDLYGHCCNLSRIVELCNRYEAPVICDSAEAMGARYSNAERGTRNVEEEGTRNSGRGGEEENSEDGKHSVPCAPRSAFRLPTSLHSGFDAWASVYSFNGNKIITTSGGGMLASHDKDLIDHARKLSQQARDPAPWYEHTEIGYNYRMSNVLAAIGRGQLQVLDERVRRKREIFAAYQHHLADVPGISFMPEPAWSHCNRWLTVILIDPVEFGADTHAVREALERENIEARPVWKPMHLQPVFKGCRILGGAVSEEFFARGLCLPSGTAMTEADVSRVASLVRGVSTSSPAGRKSTGETNCRSR